MDRLCTDATDLNDVDKAISRIASKAAGVMTPSPAMTAMYPCGRKGPVQPVAEN